MENCLNSVPEFAKRSSKNEFPKRHRSSSFHTSDFKSFQNIPNNRERSNSENSMPGTIRNFTPYLTSIEELSPISKSKPEKLKNTLVEDLAAIKITEELKSNSETNSASLSFEYSNSLITEQTVNNILYFEPQLILNKNYIAESISDHPTCEISESPDPTDFLKSRLLVSNNNHEHLDTDENIPHEKHITHKYFIRKSIGKSIGSSVSTDAKYSSPRSNDLFRSYAESLKESAILTSNMRVDNE